MAERRTTDGRTTDGRRTTGDGGRGVGDSCRGASGGGRWRRRGLPRRRCGRVAVTEAAAPVTVWPSRLFPHDLFLRFRLKKITFN